MLDSLGEYASYFTRTATDVMEDLESYCALLKKWNAAQNLVSRETHELWKRHVLDGVQLVRFLKEDDRLLCDIGSGGGLPAIPLAIALKSSERRHILIEPVGKKAAFLRHVRRELQLLDVDVHCDRVQNLPAMSADVVTARAVTALPDLLGHVALMIRSDGRALLHKGREYVDEIAAARAKWIFDVIVHRSDVDSDGVILEVSSLRPL